MGFRHPEGSPADWLRLGPLTVSEDAPDRDGHRFVLDFEGEYWYSEIGARTRPRTMGELRQLLWRQLLWRLGIGEGGVTSESRAG